MLSMAHVEISPAFPLDKGVCHEGITPGPSECKGYRRISMGSQHNEPIAITPKPAANASFLLNYSPHEGVYATLRWDSATGY